jgi:predicted RNase H-like HicB family nuclease
MLAGKARAEEEAITNIREAIQKYVEVWEMLLSTIYH